MKTIQFIEFTDLVSLNDWLNNRDADTITIVTPVFNTDTNSINYAVQYTEDLGTGTPP